MADESKSLKAFAAYVDELQEGGGGQHYGTCPFCDKEEHFFCAPDSTLWDCKVCGKAGNLYTFLEQIGAMLAEHTAHSDLIALAKDRGLRLADMKAAGVCWDPRNEVWLFPVRNTRGTIRDLRRWKPGTGCRSTPGCATGMFGAELLTSASQVWICEGEWDALAMRRVLREAKASGVVAVGVPGANTFKKAWHEQFMGKSVRVVFDADRAGKMGADRVVDALRGIAAECLKVDWPDETPEGTDVRDLIIEGKQVGWTGKAILRSLHAMLIAHDQSGPVEVDVETGEAFDPAVVKVGSIAQPMGIQRLFSIFNQWVRMSDDLRTALRYELAIVLSQELPGDPLWGYIVAPPGSGKTLLTAPLAGSERVSMHSTITPKALVSGFEGAGGKDPSLLPQLDGKCAVFKDWTEVMALHPDGIAELYATLRGAFDGHVVKNYGTGRKREYHVHFSMLAAVTTCIHAHKEATLGERFLKLEIMQGHGWNADAEIAAALEGVSDEKERQVALKRALGEFLAREVDVKNLPKIPLDYKTRLKHLVHLVAALRCEVVREKGMDRTMEYKPQPEIPTRLVKQLAKLAICLAIVESNKVVGAVEWEIVVRVAESTTNPMFFEICSAIVNNGWKTVSRDEIRKATQLPLTNVRRCLDDMELIGIVAKDPFERRIVGADGRPPITYSMTKELAVRWHGSYPQENAEAWEECYG